MKNFMKYLFVVGLLNISFQSIVAGGYGSSFDLDDDWVMVEMPTKSESANFWTNIDKYIASYYPSLQPTAQKIKEGLKLATDTYNRFDAIQFHLNQLIGAMNSAQRLYTQFPRGAQLAGKSPADKAELYGNYLQQNAQVLNQGVGAIQGLIEPLQTFSPEKYKESIKQMEKLKAAIGLFSEIADRLRSLADGLRNMSSVGSR